MSDSIASRSGFTAVFLAVACLAPQAQLRADAKPRPYKRGDLRIEEFRGTPNQAESVKAYTATRILCQYKIRESREPGRAVVTLKSAYVYAVFLPEQSWWGERAPRSLLDHEQGHFDLAEISARRLQLAINKSLATGRPITATGFSLNEARQAIEKRINELLQRADQQNQIDNREYDRRTRHGLNSREQNEQRRIQQLTLDRLATEIKRLGRRPAPRSSRRHPGR